MPDSARTDQNRVIDINGCLQSGFGDAKIGESEDQWERRSRDPLRIDRLAEGRAFGVR